MNTRKLRFICFTALLTTLIVACGTPSNPDPSKKPDLIIADRAADEPALVGDPIPDNLLNVEYISGQVALQLRPADDPICQELQTPGNCFTFLRTDHDPEQDPGARGPVSIVDGLIATQFQECPFCDPSEIGSIEYFELKENGSVLVGVRCELNTGAACNADVGSTWTATPPQTTFRWPGDPTFRVPLALRYGPGWETNAHSNAIDIVYKNQWGGGILLLNEAFVHDPATAVSNQPASANQADFVPLPNDFFAYLTSLPGVTVITAATPITIGGVQGTQMIVQTPQMHPILWLKNDFTWLGGGSTGVDPAFKRLLILLNVNGEQVLLEFDDSPEKFDERYLLMQEIFNSITFED